MALHHFMVVVDDENIQDSRFKSREGAELAGWRLYNDLSFHMGPEAELYPHIKGIYHLHYVLFSDRHWRQSAEVPND